ncbi:CSAD [Mytilus edulis]|uniref:CSAD n=1 Tax=Mytilus edulis TaxID=6550 RepID=A0A8S3T3X5_MYTED|nr:CSAD [Mytilus edulis]
MAESDNSNCLKGYSYAEPEIQQFVKDFSKLILEDALIPQTDPNTKVLNFKQPLDLQKFLDLEINEEPIPREKLLELGKKVIDGSIVPGHPHFFNTMYTAIDPYSLFGAWLTEALNCNVHTYEVSPVMVTLENYIFKKISSVIGYPDGEGIFCPVTLKTGSRPTRILSLLISKSKCAPIMFMATCGTTVLGSYDDLEAVADICQRHNVWMHADGAWGGGVMLSDKLKYLTKGIERSDSVAWNIHKMGGAGIQCSVFVVKEKGFLEKCNAYRAEYLFQPDKIYDSSYDIGDRTIQCGRKNDVLKLWLMWKGRGDKAMAARIEKAFENAAYLTEKLKLTEGFRLVLPEFQCTNISFWYIPPRLRGQNETAEWWKEVGKVAPAIKARMMLKGSIMISYQPLSSKGLVNFFRVIVGNPVCERSDMDFIVDEIIRLAEDV